LRIRLIEPDELRRRHHRRPSDLDRLRHDRTVGAPRSEKHSSSEESHAFEPTPTRRARVRTWRRSGRRSYSMRRPLIAREMTSCWICSVPSKMS
jgi:hypothetical protein